MGAVGLKWLSLESSLPFWPLPCLCVHRIAPHTSASIWGCAGAWIYSSVSFSKRSYLTICCCKDANTSVAFGVNPWLLFSAAWGSSCSAELPRNEIWALSISENQQSSEDTGTLLSLCSFPSLLFLFFLNFFLFF